MTKQLIAHKIELRPTATQAEYFRLCCGTMRFVYNKLVEKWKSGEKYNRKGFQKFCVELRQNTPWMQKVTSRATYEAADNFHAAVNRFFKKVDSGGSKSKPPKFKKKSVNESFQLSYNTQFKVSGRKLKIQGLKSQINMRESIRFVGKVKSVSVSFYCGKWYASFLVETDYQRPNIEREPSVGVDLGLKSLAVLSNGEVFENPKPLRRALRKLKRLQRVVSRRFVCGAKSQSNRYKKAVFAVAKLHRKISWIRRASQHSLTTELVRRFNRIAIEDLSVSNLLKNKRLSRSISDVGLRTIRNQLEYKCRINDVELVLVDRFFPSSKTCSACGERNDNLKLHHRTFNCPYCSSSLDRDLNAAINIDRYKSTSPPIKGRSKTIAQDLCKTVSAAKLFEGDNTNLTRKRGIATVASN